MSCCCGRRKIQIPTGIGYVDRLNQVSLLLLVTKLERMSTQLMRRLTSPFPSEFLEEHAEGRPRPVDQEESRWYFVEVACFQLARQYGEQIDR